MNGDLKKKKKYLTTSRPGDGHSSRSGRTSRVVAATSAASALLAEDSTRAIAAIPTELEREQKNMKNHIFNGKHVSGATTRLPPHIPIHYTFSLSLIFTTSSAPNLFRLVHRMRFRTRQQKPWASYIENPFVLRNKTLSPPTGKI